MPVRKTESRVPQGSQPSDLGQAVSATDNRCALISYITSPLIAGRENVWVVLVTDAGLAAAVQSFAWSFVENGGAPSAQNNGFGEARYTPAAPGQLTVMVRLLDGANSEQASLSLDQQIAAPNAELEVLLDQGRNEIGPSVSNSEVVRELINEHNLYYQNVTAAAPEAGDAFQRFVFMMVHNGALQRTPAERGQHLEELAAALNDDSVDFVTATAEGAGVCSVRLALLAMVFGPLLDWAELPDIPPQHAAADEQLRERLAAIDETSRIDLFNLVRFPKSNITQCARIIEALRDHYFPGTNFNDVLTGMSATRAHWIVRHYREGPLVRS